jgi:hypothetical protein
MIKIAAKRKAINPRSCRERLMFVSGSSPPYVRQEKGVRNGHFDLLRWLNLQIGGATTPWEFPPSGQAMPARRSCCGLAAFFAQPGSPLQLSAQAPPHVRIGDLEFFGCLLDGALGIGASRRRLQASFGRAKDSCEDLRERHQARAIFPLGMRDSQFAPVRSEMARKFTASGWGPRGDAISSCRKPSSGAARPNAG